VFLKFQTEEVIMIMQLTAIFKEEKEGGYSAYCSELGVASQGETVEEAKKNLIEACELYIESAKELGMIKDIKEELSTNSVLNGVISVSV